MYICIECGSIYFWLRERLDLGPKSLCFVCDWVGGCVEGCCAVILRSGSMV